MLWIEYYWRILQITTLATKAALNTNSTEIENKITDTTDLITTLEFNRLTKISFDEEIKEAAKNKTHVDNPLFIHLN